MRERNDEAIKMNGSLVVFYYYLYKGFLLSKRWASFCPFPSALVFVVSKWRGRGEDAQMLFPLHVDIFCDLRPLGYIDNLRTG